MDNHEERRGRDELSEILSRNKERRLMEEERGGGAHEDKVGVFREELFGTTKPEARSRQNSESKPSSDRVSDTSRRARSAAERKASASIRGKGGGEFNEDELHDIEFDSETDKPITDKALRRAREAQRQLKKQRQTRKTIFQIICGVIVSGAVIFFGVKLGTGLYSAISDYGGLEDDEFQVAVEIPDNPSVDQVAEALKESGIVQEPDAFKLYIELKNKDEDWRHKGEAFIGGEYILSSSMNYSTIIDTLLPSGSARNTVDVTIIEGMTAIEIGRLLEENFVCRAEDFEKYYREKMDKYDFERRVTPSYLKFNQLEGYLFPDRYEFYECSALKADPEAEIDTSKQAEVAAEKIYSNFNSKITKSMYKQMNEMGLTLDQLITLASMVQSEVSNVDDMKKVASVFLNRLESGGDFSKLQSDVTVFYVQDFIEPYYEDYGLTTSLAAISHAYDTYECDGVPVGAICNPGMDAISAVLDAEDTDYYYFCANEETGETFYATTLEEHEANLVLAGLV
ncbi:MAG: endolytic transglycosylase MltG [Bacteroides sp.]|nr:endolytic transglycosylase MltG [Bacteroides sp.]